jgi:hypothetical protein
MRAKRWILLGAAVSFTTLVVWVVLSLQNDDSSLSVVARLATTYVKQTMCWSADSNPVCVLRTMAKYEKKGRSDDAARTGVAWAEKYPDSATSELIYWNLSALYLRSARMDSGRAEDYLKQAVFYRDKVLPSASNSPYALQSLVAISESVGDLSKAQRCVQYGDSIKLLDRMKLLANEDKDRLARQFKPDLAERKKTECLLEWIDEGIKRLNGKLSASGCQGEHRSPG